MKSAKLSRLSLTLVPVLAMVTVFVLIAGAAFPLQAQTESDPAQPLAIVHNTWTSGALIPKSVWAPAVGVLAGQIYVVGGFDASNTPIADTQIYNPVTNTWSTGVSLPVATADASAAVVKNVLYVIGGTASPSGCFTVTNAVWAFNPKTKAWSSKTTMPTARCSMGVALENNIIYVVGGYSTSGGGTRLNKVESYNPATDTWTEEAPLLNGKSEPSVGLVGNKTIGFTIVAADGCTSSSCDNGDNEGYDATTNVWSPFKADPNPRNGGCGAGIGTKMFVAGGDTGGPPGTPALSVTEKFTVSTNAWKVLASMPQATMFPGSAVYKGRLYCYGGTSSYLGTVLNNVQIYQP